MTRAPKVTKYRSTPTDHDGVRYHSKAEARRAAELDLLRRAGEVRWWVGQVKFRLGTALNVYVVDFLVCGKGGSVWAEDVKGARTQKFNRDVKLWAAHGPVPLHVITRGRVVEIVEARGADL